MELKKLEYLEAIYRLHSFTRAAEEQYISQPSITSAIRKLEAELGTELIDRKSKMLNFTPKGERFMEHVYRILEEVDEAIDEIQSSDGHSAHTIRLFAASIAADWFLPNIFSEYIDENPDTDIFLSTGSYNEMLRQLNEETLDIAFSIFPEQFSSYTYETIPLMHCHIVLLLSQNHPLANEEVISMEQLEKERLLLPRKGTLIRQSVAASMRKRKLKPTYRSIQQIRVIERLVEQNKGIGVTTSDCQEAVLNQRGIVVKPIDEEIVFLKGFIMKKGKVKSSEMKRIIKFTRQIIEKRNRNL